MISQHSQTATLRVGVSQEQLAEGMVVEAIAELQDFIALRPDARKVRKALAIKLVYQGYLYDEIQTILDVSRGSFAPNCPVQNPIEDIWLQAKTWVRRFCALIPSFSHLKWIFEWFIRHTTFDFDTLQMYGAYSKIK